jgi:ferredoxin
MKVDKDACVGCCYCSIAHPEIFKMENYKAVVISGNSDKECEIECPMNAITK